MEAKKIAVIVGSLRKESYNRKLAGVLFSVVPETLKLEFVEIGSLPLYNEDLDINPPAEWQDFRNKMKTFQGTIFVTPEYNRSIPAALKNAVDVGSRPYMENVWSGMPAAILSASPGATGGFGATHHLRQILVCVNMAVMPQPEMYIGKVHGLFDEKGTLTSENTRKLLKDFLTAFETWTGRNGK
ncbi:MAG: NAD(P)H-dependent oxidoreductase [Bacteroidales bacterium]|jgi:chromate reductase|nr:NAD(P)H-dependent oxidoreductase [Bacteroidales bacterium]MDD4257721.1 NAD(P)H-dependent oxidoreductase [Bacteroidales bacterium]MDD4828155.1 NAD(P)H-dependent oxidoreductase [Bacteroidales bacterium]HPS24580.1 NAD(P)H-dependent oxidoreductase [Bacteroidales bacterium]